MHQYKSEQLRSPAEPDVETQNRILALIDAGALNEAQQKTESLLETYQEHHFVWQSLGTICRLQQRLNDAKTYYDKAIGLCPQNDEILTDFAGLLSELNLFDEALALIHNHMRNQLPTEKRYNALGRVYLQQNKDKEAAKAFEQAIKLNPEFGEAYFHYGVILSRSTENKLVEATEYFERALELNYAQIETLFCLAAVWNDLGDFSAAEDCYLEIIETNPEEAAALSLLANLYLTQEIPEAALEYSEKAIELNPHSAALYDNHALALHLAGQFSTALETSKRSIALEPSSIHGYINALLILSEQRNWAECEYYCNKVLDIESTNRFANSILLHALYFQERDSDLLQYLDRLYQRDPFNPIAASIAPHLCHQMGQENRNPLCSDPLSMVKIYSIKDYSDKSDGWIQAALELAMTQSRTVHPSLLDECFLTNSNFWEEEHECVVALKGFHEACLRQYREDYKDRADLFIQAWPPECRLSGWFNFTKSPGSLPYHMHASAWLTAAFYLEMPDNLSDSEANVVFGKRPDYLSCRGTAKALPIKEIKPKVGDLIIFPSFLYHETKPFNSDQNRVMLATDFIRMDDFSYRDKLHVKKMVKSRQYWRPA